MSSYYLIVPVFLPILAGLFLSIKRLRSRAVRQAIIGSVSILNALIVWALILFGSREGLVLFNLANNLAVEFRFDGLGRLFAGLVSTLWPVTTFYAFEYMDRHVHGRSFYQFFLISFGVTVGIAMSGNLITMYCFYEMLTLATVPLVMYPGTKAALKATSQYLVLSVGGAAFTFVSMVYLMTKGYSLEFMLGGNIAAASAGDRDILLYIYLASFLGFGVKSAVFPLYKWLPSASVAPTPVTALLHAVAVVKAGVFAIARLTWYIFSPGFLEGTWAHTAAMCLAIFTILFGSVMAMRQKHWKLRLAYSTVSNLSYITFGVLLLTPAGLSAGLMHMLFHGTTKILAFFCAGSVLHHSGREFVGELDGIGYRMPVTFGCFAIASLALTGIPLFDGFVSKWNLLTAAAETASPLALAGAVVILVSALLTAVYMLTVVVRAFFPSRDTDTAALQGVHEAGGLMCVPMVLLAFLCVLFGVWAMPLVQLTRNIAMGLF